MVSAGTLDKERCSDEAFAEVVIFYGVPYYREF